MNKITMKQENSLFQSMSMADWDEFFPKLEAYELPLGKVLYEINAKEKYAYFPTNSIVSILHKLENGSTAEISVIGNEGVIGVEIFMGGLSTTTTAVVQSGGKCYRISSFDFFESFEKSTSFKYAFLRFTQALITQMTQTALCNRYHNLEQQLCRWLLLGNDRLFNDELVMTQKLISNMLGVRREGVTESASKLQKLGLIKYKRGHITILDRKGIESKSCECYQVVKTEYDRLMPKVAEH